MPVCGCNRIWLKAEVTTQCLCKAGEDSIVTDGGAHEGHMDMTRIITGKRELILLQICFKFASNLSSPCWIT